MEENTARLDNAFRTIFIRDFEDERGMHEYLEEEYDVDYERLEQFYLTMIDDEELGIREIWALCINFFLLGINYESMTRDSAALDNGNLDFLREN